MRDRVLYAETDRPWQEDSKMTIRFKDPLPDDPGATQYFASAWPKAAEEIVTACNAHDELVAALERCEAWLVNDPLRRPRHVDSNAVIAAANAALAKAKGNTP